MTTGRRTWIAAAVLLMASTGFYFWRGDALAPAEPIFDTAPVSRGTLSRSVIATGVVRPVVGAEIDVGSRISGRLVDLPVQVGDVVEAGNLLARLDASELEAVVAQVEADLALARAQLEQARSAFERRRRLADEGIVPAEDLEVTRRDLEVARARVDAGEARRVAAEINLDYTRIRAPIRGVIADVTTRQGETVAASFAAPTFVTIVDLDRLEVRAFVDETDIGRVYLGQTATFSVDTYPDAELAAVVTAIEPKAEIRGSVVNYVVVLDFEPLEDRVLRPEMTAHVRLELGRREDVLTVPRGVLRRRDGRSYVSVWRDEAWGEQEVATGWRTDRAIEILQGLAEGETVRVNPK